MATVGAGLDDSSSHSQLASGCELRSRGARGDVQGARRRNLPELTSGSAGSRAVPSGSAPRRWRCARSARMTVSTRSSCSRASRPRSPAGRWLPSSITAAGSRRCGSSRRGRRRLTRSASASRAAITAGCDAGGWRRSWSGMPPRSGCARWGPAACATSSAATIPSGCVARPSTCCWRASRSPPPRAPTRAGRRDRRGRTRGVRRARGDGGPRPWLGLARARARDRAAGERRRGPALAAAHAQRAAARRRGRRHRSASVGARAARGQARGCRSSSATRASWRAPTAC